MIFRNLRTMRLGHVKINELFFRRISKFSCLKDLTVDNCDGYGEIQICSNSLQRISFINHRFKIRPLRAKFDVPRIKKFKLSISCVPSLSFKTTSTEWESDISIRCILENQLFVEFRKFLQELSPSKIHGDLRF